VIRKLLISASLIAASWPGIASAAWQQATSKHFIVYADDKPEKITAFTERLEKFDKALRFFRGMTETPVADADRVRVYMVGDVRTIARLAGKGMSNVAGFYEPRVGGPVAFVPRNAPKSSAYDLDAQSILFHEYAHHFMFTTFPSSVFPAWLVEGFAEFNATAIFNADGSVMIGQIPGYRVWNVQDSTLVPAQRLIQLDPGKLNDEQTDALYARGWLLTHLLMFDPSRKGQLNQYIAAINAGKQANDAASVFGDLKKLDRDMTAYVARPKIIVENIPADKLKIDPIKLRLLDAGEAAVMPALIQSTRGVDGTSAQAVVKLARRLAAPFPTDAGAQNELAEAELDAGNLDEADAAATRALAADPKSIHALTYKGLIYSAQLAKAMDKDPAHWRIVRRWFVEANKLDPDNPRPLMLFYASFLQARLPPTKNAEDGLITAYEQAPFAFDLRMTAAGILLKRGDKDGARAALLPVAYSPHRAAYAAVALQVLAAIDGGNLKDAIAILDRGADRAKQSESSGAGATP
jgi:tetratricopeptide (TPR) repeat protein